MEIDLFEEVYKLTRQIPRGRVSSYGAIAKALGDLIASRAVGFILNQNPDLEYTPCYRVVNSDGNIGGFSLGLEEKIKRLKKDGIEVKDGRIVNFEEIFFDDFSSDYPLKRLRKEQIDLRKRIVLKDDFDEISTIAGLDVSYSKKDKRLACAACIVMNNNMEILERSYVIERIKFPYIPTYLSYREIPLYSKVIKKLKNKVSIFMVDGNGILHPYGIGIASHLGIDLDVPSIGIAKKPLFGEIKNNFVFDKDKKLGYILYTSKNPIYVSPGHRISIETSADLVRRFSIYRIPEPVRQAHIYAKSKIVEVDQRS